MNQGCKQVFARSEGPQVITVDGSTPIAQSNLNNRSLIQNSNGSSLQPLDLEEVGKAIVRGATAEAQRQGVHDFSFEVGKLIRRSKYGYISSEKPYIKFKGKV